MGVGCDEALHVRTLAGHIIFTLPRPLAEELLVLRVKHDLREVIRATVADGITEGRLLLTTGSCILEDHETFSPYWPKSGGNLELQLVIRRTREDDVEQKVITSLNKIQATGVEGTVEELAAIEPRTPSELLHVIGTLFSKSIADPSHCEHYVDAIIGVRTSYPEFPPTSEDDKPVTFTRALLNRCQQEFENTFSMGKLSGTNCNKEKALALMNFIGHLFLRRLVSPRVIGLILVEMIVFHEGAAPEHINTSMESACALLQVVGQRLDEGEANCRKLMDDATDRMRDLLPTVSKEVQILAHKLFDRRARGWPASLGPVVASARDVH